MNKDNIACRNAVNQQAEIATLLLAPLLTACLVFMPLVLIILYSDNFLEAVDFISWACIGMMLRVPSWALSFMLLAKAESRIFVISEFIGCTYYTLFSILGYRLGGLQGIGIGFSLNYLCYFIQVYLIAHYRYQFRFTGSFIRCYSIQFFLVAICLATVLLSNGIAKYAIGISLICISCCLGFRGLNQRMDLTSVIKSKLHK